MAPELCLLLFPCGLFVILLSHYWIIFAAAPQIFVGKIGSLLYKCDEENYIDSYLLCNSTM